VKAGDIAGRRIAGAARSDRGFKPGKERGRIGEERRSLREWRAAVQRSSGQRSERPEVEQAAQSLRRATRRPMISPARPMANSVMSDGSGIAVLVPWANAAPAGIKIKSRVIGTEREHAEAS